MLTHQSRMRLMGVSTLEMSTRSRVRSIYFFEVGRARQAGYAFVNKNEWGRRRVMKSRCSICSQQHMRFVFCLCDLFVAWCAARLQGMKDYI